jgi:predicted RNase H-like HicB family nuclease
LSEGDDINEALVNIKSAIALYIEPVEENINLTEGAIIQEIVV